MSSTRLPGKVMRPLAGTPVVRHVVDRATRIAGIDGVVVATSESAADDGLAHYLRDSGVEVVRGSETDVLGRYLVAAKAAEAEAVVRLTADCPLLSPAVSGRVVARLRAGGCDYASNTLRRTYPRGLDTSAFTMEALSLTDARATESEDREHVTTFMRRHPEDFRLCSVIDDVDRSALRWTLDTPEDLELLERIFDALGAKDSGFDYADVLALLALHPDWPELNRHVRQKEVG